MLNQKKSQGMSINVIIIVIIALIVLVVIVAIFTGRMGSYSKGVTETSGCGQMCKAFGYTSGSKMATGGTQTDSIKDSDSNPCTCAT